MNTVIYYFSGTGNSLFMARRIAEKTGAILIPIAGCMDEPEIDPAAHRVGIVFPCYYGDLPLIVRDFASKLKNIESKYIFAVCNYGGSSGESFNSLRRILHSLGGELSATYGIHMPQNAFFKPWENYPRIYTNCEKKLEVVARNTQVCKKGAFFTVWLARPFFKLLHACIKSLYLKSFARLSQASPDLPLDTLMRMTDSSYRAGEKCNGCGICAHVCPVHNIEMVNEKPEWQHRCEACLACYNFCPQKAIAGGVVHAGYYYRHPGVKVSEMIRGKNHSDLLNIVDSALREK